MKHCKRHIPKEKRYVQPFKAVAHFLEKNKSWTICHGKIAMVPDRAKTLVARKRDHAWCERMGMVYDPFYDLMLTQSDYYRLFQVQKVTKYTKQEARERMDTLKRYGLWEIPMRGIAYPDV